MKRWWQSKLVFAAAGLLFAPLLHGQATVFPFEQQVTFSDPCAVFNVQYSPTVTRITYGEPIDFDLKGATKVLLVAGSNGQVNLKFEVNAHGDGIGNISGIKYQFGSRAVLKANTNGGDPTAPGFVFNGRFKVDARIIGQGNAASAGVVAQGAQDNALLHFYVAIHYANGQVQSAASDFTMECAASPWTNQMTAPNVLTKKPVGRGFGDPWNKYAWSMKDFRNGMVVGTKNAYYDAQVLLGTTTNVAVEECMNSGFYLVTGIHLPLACMELFAAPNSYTSPALADADAAEIWRFDYAKKSWTKVLDAATMGAAPQSQGFRVMAVHNGKLYAGSDLGAFITGVDLHAGKPYEWNFPGAQILVSSDGKSFQTVPCDIGLCNPAEGVINPYGVTGSYPNFTAVNTSIRALASFMGKLYVGTFNTLGGELWSYDDGSGTWAFVAKFSPNNPYVSYKPAIAELRVYDGKLYIGVAGPGVTDYLYQYTGSGNPTLVVGLPPLPSTNVGTLKLFTSSKGLLYIGTVDLSLGFTLQSYDGTDVKDITVDGFGNPANAYAWSMAEIDGRVFVGTFNQDMDFLNGSPRGAAELWYSDDAANWQQMALPLDWGLWNYGIRTMEVGNKQLFLGSASHMVAPDLIAQPIPLGPGTEVWTLRTSSGKK